ncbi:CoA pyrophosphatase [Phenylobacterium sp. 20VBR1]|uniref:CoA pyrophosphatase n=1 Tax=Phenylobacterium glaciei TaxID=2803784 RepID=A0A941CZV3_9CAUL|nr:CoA pyrophosphatase [Phenylobacterium glaciei]MBR7618952.1 CoA pyrophosphatase [Phenylobacterium glaciei]
MHADRDRIAANLAAFPRIALETGERRRAAVAIVLSARDGELTYLLTRRALTMRRGAGNYALPGGNLEPGEDAIAGAIRETSEELGVAIAPEEALGMLDDFETLGGHVVTPVVFWTDETLSLSPDPTEVDRAWFEPVARLDHPGSPMSEEHPDGGEPILRMFADDNWINPPTAAWLYQFREVGLYGRLIRVSRIGQPEWTAR